jgi:hypothetical protein
MVLLDLVTLPARLTMAAVDTTPALGHGVEPAIPVRGRSGYATRVMLVRGQGNGRPRPALEG